jgi:hypothetical protein
LRQEFADNPPDEQTLSQVERFRVGKQRTYIRLADPLTKWGRRSMLLGAACLIILLALHFF